MDESQGAHFDQAKNLKASVARPKYTISVQMSASASVKGPAAILGSIRSAREIEGINTPSKHAVVIERKILTPIEKADTKSASGVWPGLK